MSLASVARTGRHDFILSLLKLWHLSYYSIYILDKSFIIVMACSPSPMLNVPCYVTGILQINQKLVPLELGDTECFPKTIHPATYRLNVNKYKDFKVLSQVNSVRSTWLFLWVNSIVFLERRDIQHPTETHLPKIIKKMRRTSLFRRQEGLPQKCHSCFFT